MEKSNEGALKGAGRAAAIAMLREMQDVGADVTAVGVAQINVLRRYLDRVRALGDQAIEREFVAVLNDFIGSALDGATPDPEFYET